MFEPTHLYFFVTGNASTYTDFLLKIPQFSAEIVFIVTEKGVDIEAIVSEMRAAKKIVPLKESDPIKLARILVAHTESYLDPINIFLAKDALSEEERSKLYFALQKEGERAYLLDDALLSEKEHFTELLPQSDSALLFDRAQEFKD